MKTKRIIAAATAAAAILAACTKTENAVKSADGIRGTAELSVSIPALTATKASGSVSESEENALRSVQVFVFTESGNLETCKTATSGQLDLSCTKGSKTVAALVNAAEVSDITTLAELRGKTTLLTGNSAGSFIMYGQKTVQVNAASVAVALEVQRFAAKVVINKITNRMSLAQYQSAPIEVTGIYLINVAGDAAISGDAAPTLWLNKAKNEAGADCLYREKPSALKVAYNSSDSDGHYFYCYPNPTVQDDARDAWSPRHTRLVVEAVIGGRTCYYPITLPAVNGNTIYTIGELTITRIGTDTPDVETVMGGASFTISVAPWKTEDVNSVTI